MVRRALPLREISSATSLLLEDPVSCSASDGRRNAVVGTFGGTIAVISPSGASFACANLRSACRLRPRVVDRAGWCYVLRSATCCYVKCRPQCATTATAAGRVIVQTPRAHVGGVLVLAATRDGAALFSGGEDGTVRLWSLPQNDDDASSGLTLAGELEIRVRVCAAADTGVLHTSGAAVRD
jgi:WD40 repeat protein